MSNKVIIEIKNVNESFNIQINKLFIKWIERSLNINNFSNERYSCRIIDEETNEEKLNRSVTWSVDDFAHMAKRRNDIYDPDKYENALKLMIEKHDCDCGITWDTVMCYLDEYCLKDKNYTKDDHEDYLNDLYNVEQCLQLTQHCWAGNDKKSIDKSNAKLLALVCKYGSVIRKYDVIAFNVSYNEI